MPLAPPGLAQFDVPTNHHLRHVFLGRLIGAYCGNSRALPKYSHAVGDIQYLAYLVGHNDNRQSLISHAAQNRKQCFRFLRGLYSCGFIKDEQLYPMVECFEDFNPLLLSDR